MWDRLRTLLGRESVEAGPPIEQTTPGDSLDDSIDAIRQTQMVDPSQFRNDPEPSQPAANKTKKRTARRKVKKTSGVAAVNRETPLYCPTVRPPMAFLAALDDGSIKDAEIHRLRGGRIVLGREDGDYVFPYEVLMSAKHAQIECRRSGDAYHWHFVDLNSRNGSFFRVERALMRDGQEFLLGAHRFAFRMPLPDGGFPDQTSEVPAQADDALATQLVQPLGKDLPMPKLQWRGPSGREQTYQLDRPHIVIGSDPATCALSIGNDAYLCPNHAKLHLTQKGWLVEDLGSRNGTWLRLHEAKLDQVTEFQLGEQRFYFRPPKTRAKQ